MSWYDGDWKRRSAIIIDNHSGASQIDVEAVIPTDWPTFWDNVLSSGDDVRVTLSDGFTLADYQLNSWNYANKTGKIQINDMAASSTTAAVVAYVYWDNAAAASAAGSFTVSAPKTGYIENQSPGSGSSPIIRCRPETPGASNPRTEISKASAEEIHVWWDLRRVLARRAIPYENSNNHEGVDTVTYDVLTGNQSQAAMIDLSSIRQVGSYIRTTIKFGSSDSNYLAKLTVTTDLGRVLDFRCTVRVKDVAEPT